jgi:hypothetical protein
MTMPTRDYEPDHAGMAAWLRSPEAHAIVTDAAEHAADYVRAAAPVRTGRFRASVGVQQSHGYDGRAAADVVADVDYAVEVERNTHVLKRAAQIIES